MPDAVSVKTIANTPNQLVLFLTNVSDGSGESAAVKADKSTFTAADGAEPASLDIERIEFITSGMTATLLWDHTTDDTAVILSGTGVLDFTRRLRDPYSLPVLADPRSAGGTGDLLLTTTGHSNGDFYYITIWLKKQSD